MDRGWRKLIPSSLEIKHFHLAITSYRDISELQSCFCCVLFDFFFFSGFNCHTLRQNQIKLFWHTLKTVECSKGTLILNLSLLFYSGLCDIMTWQKGVWCQYTSARKIVRNNINTTGAWHTSNISKLPIYNVSTLKWIKTWPGGAELGNSCLKTDRSK